MLAEALDRLERDGEFRTILNNPLASFGPPAQPLLGASILPDRNVEENQFTEQAIRYRSIIANSGTRYSRPQKKRGVLIGSADVKLGHADVQSELTGRDYDALLATLRRVGQGDVSMAAAPTLLRWADLTMTRPLRSLREKQRWDAIVNAQVIRTGDDNYAETVNYSNPTGHRVNAGGDWTDPAYDPWLDIIDMANTLYDKGYQVSRIVAGRAVINTLLRNAKIAERSGILTIIGGVITGRPSRVTPADLAALAAREGLPAVEEYNATYRTQVGFDYYLPRNAMVFLAATGQDEVLDFGDDDQMVLNDTLGYYGVGTPAGQANPGTATWFGNYEDKPPRIEGQAWEVGLPVITEPEAIGVIKNITTV